MELSLPDDVFWRVMCVFEVWKIHYERMPNEFEEPLRHRNVMHRIGKRLEAIGVWIEQGHMDEFQDQIGWKR